MATWREIKRREYDDLVNIRNPSCGSFYLFRNGNHASDEKIGVIISYVGFIFGLFLIIGYINSRPKAIDVYKGKTELRVTYEGNTPVDSVVVFKK